MFQAKALIGKMFEINLKVHKCMHICQLGNQTNQEAEKRQTASASRVCWRPKFMFHTSHIQNACPHVWR